MRPQMAKSERPRSRDDERGNERTRAKRGGSERPATAAEAKRGDKLPWVLGAVVVGLAGIVYWSLPKDGANGGDGANGANTGDAAIVEGDAGSGANADDKPAGVKTTFKMLAMASSEHAILTDKPSDVVQKAITREALGKILDVKHCGSTCDTLKRALEQEDRFEVDVMTSEEYILPPEETMDTTAPGLTATERAAVHKKPTAVVVRTQAPVADDALAARLAFAVTSALADTLDGFVYDQTGRRIESKTDFAKRVITTPIGQPAFRPKHIVVQHYRQEDGTARLLTLGMDRFGSPDLIVAGANMGTGDKLSLVLVTVASQIAEGKRAPFTVTLDDVARALDKRPTELGADPAKSKAVKLDVFTSERSDGDPNNEILDLGPEGGFTREGWENLVATLFGTPVTADVPFDKEQETIAEKARRDLPDAIKRFKSGEGALYVKGAFTIPEESRKDGGPTTEWLWLGIASCDANHTCVGSPSGDPAYATDLAPGKNTSVAKKDVVDWLLQQRDGGTAGGASITYLKKKLATP